MLMIGHPGCTTCKRAREFLDKAGVEYEWRDIREQNPTKDELKTWQAKSGRPLKRFFNTSGQLYRDQGISAQLPTFTEEEQYDLLASSGMMVRRPILLGDDFILVGFKQAEWEEKISNI